MKKKIMCHADGLKAMRDVLCADRERGDDPDPDHREPNWTVLVREMRLLLNWMDEALWVETEPARYLLSFTLHPEARDPSMVWGMVAGNMRSFAERFSSIKSFAWNYPPRSVEAREARNHAEKIAENMRLVQRALRFV
jgi:hypothetical protein